MRLSSSPTHQSISGPCWTRAYCRGRDEDFSSPPAQIPACAANAPGSSLGSNVGGAHGLKPQALPRTAANRIDAAFRLSVRTAAA